MRFLAPLLSLLCLPAGLFAQSALEKFSSATHTLPSGYKIPYRFLQPEKITPGKKYPLVLFLHGVGERGTDNAKQVHNGAELFADPARRAEFPCFVIVPQCPPNSFWGIAPVDSKRKTVPDQPLNAVLDLLDQTIRQHPVDSRRVYVVGLSMGGYGTWRVLAERPNFFAAAIPICGGGDPATAVSFRRTPIWIFHGLKDTVVSPENSKKMLTALEKAGGKPRSTFYPDVAHDAWWPALRDPATWQWLFSQKK